MNTEKWGKEDENDHVGRTENNVPGADKVGHIRCNIVTPRGINFDASIHSYVEKNISNNIFK